MLTPTASERPSSSMGAFGHGRRLADVADSPNEHRELVAALAGRDIAGANGPRQPPGDLDQEAVAGGVSE